MSRTAIVSCLAILFVASSCVTRELHQNEVAKMQGEIDAANADRDKLRLASDAEIEAKRAELDQLERRLKETRAEAATRQKALAKDLRASQAEINELRRQRARIEKRLAEFKALREQLKEMITAGKIKVYQRRGRIMVALPSSVLFPSGKADLSPGGQKALAQVAKALKDLKNRRFLVAGHTDNVPIKESGFLDNWQLSAVRATNVTRYLVQNGVSPRMVAAAGYGQYDALRKNSTPTNRRLNRRIEIVLMPNLADLDLPD